MRFSNAGFGGLLGAFFMKRALRSSTLVAVASSWFGVGCVTEMRQEEARSAFASDFHCPQAQAHETGWYSRFRRIR